jgi:hypothetical protein
MESYHHPYLVFPGVIRNTQTPVPPLMQIIEYVTHHRHINFYILPSPYPSLTFHIDV